MSSESVEMYLVTIALLGEEGYAGYVPLTRLADELSVQSVSANQMIRKMDDEGLVSYLPYKGVELTDAGKQKANHILRHRRLWEVFFVEQLGLPPGEAENLACRMEHDTTSKVSDRLASYLENPIMSPSGRMIPLGSISILPEKSWSLIDLNVGQQGKVVAFEVDKITSGFLQNEGVEPGVNVIIEAISSQGHILIRVKNQRISITKDIAEKIKVKAMEQPLTYAA